MVQLLERHCTAALSEDGRKQIDVPKLHAAAVTATLNAVIAYAEWAPLTDLAKSGIINLYVSYVVYLSSSVKYSCYIITLVFCSFPPSFCGLPSVVVSYYLLQNIVFMLLSFSNLFHQGLHYQALMIDIF